MKPAPRGPDRHPAMSDSTKESSIYEAQCARDHHFAGAYNPVTASITSGRMKRRLHIGEVACLLGTKSPRPTPLGHNNYNWPPPTRWATHYCCLNSRPTTALQPPQHSQTRESIGLRTPPRPAADVPWRHRQIGYKSADHAVQHSLGKYTYHCICEPHHKITRGNCC